MKTIFALLAFMGAASAQPPIVVYQPAPSATVISPLTAPAARASQSLLSQINGTLNQRPFEHRVLTLPRRPAVSLPATNPPRVIRGK